MKILHVISGGDTGGAKTHVISLLKELQKRISVDLVCFMESDFTEEAKRANINIQIFKQKTRLDFAAVKKVVLKIKQENYDIIHCHGARANFISLMLKARCRKPIVTTIHSDYKLDFQGDFFKNLVFTNINSFSLKFIDYYIGVSQSFKEMMVERGFPTERIYSVYNGIDFDKELQFISKEEFFRKHAIPLEKNIIYVGIMGRLHPVKGHEVFLTAAHEAHKKNKNLRFLIAGDGEEESKLREQIKALGMESIVHLTGFISNPFDFFNAVDINTLTSYSESFPYVILEGALLKKPTISSNVGGIKDMLINGKTGYVFDIADSGALGEKILELAGSEEKRVLMGNGLYEIVKEKYSTKNMAEEHMEIYKDIIKRSK